MGNKATLVLVVVGVSALILWANNATMQDGTNRSVLKGITDAITAGSVAIGAAQPQPGNAPIAPVTFPRGNYPRGNYPISPETLPTLPLPGQVQGAATTALYPLGAIWGYPT